MVNTHTMNSSWNQDIMIYRDMLNRSWKPNEACIQMLFEIVSYAFEKGIVPTDWNKGIIQPIPKSSSNDPRLPSNFRGITLMSVPCKIYCQILNTRLSSWIEEHGHIAEEQNGFRPNRSCMDHLSALYNVISLQKDKKKSALICFVDAKKAFDNVNRSCLWYKLQRCGVQGKMLAAIQSLYQGVECAVRINSVLSNWFNVPNGVKQGCVLSPTLFALFIDDLAEDIKALQCGIDIGNNSQISILLFADDIALITDNEEKMQRMLNCLYNWCSRWRLSLNMDKTKIVHFRHNTQERSIVEFKFGDSKIDYESKYKYLGLWLEEHLNHIHTVKPLASSAGRALGVLMTKYHQAGGMSYEVFTHLYNAMVLPVPNYGAGIWGTTSFSVINTIQNRACRFFLGVGGNAPNCATRGDMGWTSQLHRQYIEVARLYYRLETIDFQRLNSVVYRFSTNRRSKTLWINKVKRLFSTLQFDYTNINTSSKVYIKNFQDCLHKIDQVKWYHDLFNDKNCINGNKLRVYRLFKDRLGAEPYLKAHLTRYEQSILAKLRTGTLPLEVEVGRYKKKPLDMRLCSLCSSNQIEDETHFLIDCQFYDDLRYDMMQSLSKEFEYFNSSTSLVKLILAMYSRENIKIIATTAVKMFKRKKLYS